MRALLASILLSLLASPALAREPEAVEAEAVRVEPSAMHLDGVKLDAPAPLPKQRPVQARRCSSGCTLILTY